MSAPQPFEPVPAELDFPKYEQKILELWRAEKIFERVQAAPAADAPGFVFYEGPPTANGLPHNGHVLTRVVKDLFPRYQSMRGARVLRKGGWDTHGLPVEVEVEKELGIHGKAAIEAYGVRPFVERCIESVFRYTTEWERLTERLGFWVSLDDAYVTYHRSFVESAWWAMSELFKKGLLYQGHKVVWWWAQGGTALSSAEVGLGYKTVDDPSVFVEFPLVDTPDTALVVWTTTP
jgi:isoleucyl-tRNA synthetase